ncbi:hypothetical protein [Halospeciosus flavus]|uniref:Uncharacterized protein n=1 Tax=Halospeciosus flavus TaxID=3032283 RepID=A0ABD5Z958_9EURY|nr:hypothetical protein [Halospeciosus flavus]
MSSPSTSTTFSSRVESVRQHAPSVPLTALRRSIQAVAFWTGVALPFLYVPLALAGLHSPSAVVACLSLVALHAVTLFVGRNHHAGD